MLESVFLDGITILNHLFMVAVTEKEGNKRATRVGPTAGLLTRRRESWAIARRVDLVVRVVCRLVGWVVGWLVG